MTTTLTLVMIGHFLPFDANRCEFAVIDAGLDRFDIGIDDLANCAAFAIWTAPQVVID